MRVIGECIRLLNNLYGSGRVGSIDYKNGTFERKFWDNRATQRRRFRYKMNNGRVTVYACGHQVTEGLL